MKDNYSYTQALDDIELFLRKHIKEQSELNTFIKILNDCRSRKTVPVRGVQQLFADYCKKYENFFTYSKDEKEMWDDLFYFWQ